MSNFLAFVSHLTKYVNKCGEVFTLLFPKTLRMGTNAGESTISSCVMRGRDDLPFRLECSAKRQVGALSLLKVESTVCFQRKRRRSRA